MTLTARALGIDHVLPVLLPCGTLGTNATRDAILLLDGLHIPTQNRTIIDIQKIVNEYASIDPPIDKLRRGNIMARVRMTILFDQAKKRHALVVGTENRTEHLLGYFTRFGDEASDIEPLRNLYKSEVFLLAKYLNIPSQILTKAPTAGLWEGQTDEKEFGFSYSDADIILYLATEEHLSTEEILSQCSEKGFNPDTVREVLARMNKNAYKHHLPLVL
jgi:NAD+ synthase